MSDFHHPRAAGRQHGQAGFTLMEMVVSLFVVTLLLVGILTLFDSTSKVARAQTYVAELQQSVRVAQDEMVRYTRIAARGGLTQGLLPDDFVTVEVRNNVQDGAPAQSVSIGTAGSPLAMPDTDILTVRGVFDHLYFLNTDPGGGAITFDDPDNPTSGTLIVQNPIPSTGMAQSLQALIGVVNNNRAEAILIASPLGGTLYHVVELNPAASDVSNPSRLSLAFNITGGVRNDDYNKVSANAAFPPELRSVAYIGIVEEYRFYVRKVVDPANPGAPALSRLSQARVYPGGETPYDGVSGLAVDVADDIVDLQVALAIDRNNDGAIGAETFDANDEWLFNAAADSPLTPADWNGTGRKLFYVRLNTLARTARRDFQAISSPITKIEDRDYNETAAPATNAEGVAREYRRRLLQTVVDLRNL